MGGIRDAFDRLDVMNFGASEWPELKLHIPLVHIHVLVHVHDKQSKVSHTPKTVSETD